jgi:hypothetical protein
MALSGDDECLHGIRTAAYALHTHSMEDMLSASFMAAGTLSVPTPVVLELSSYSHVLIPA